MADTPDISNPSSLILGETNILNAASRDYASLASDVEADKDLIEEVDTNLYNAFVGLAGDAFYRAAKKVELQMQNIITRYNNSSTGLFETSLLFTDVDDVQKENIETKSTHRQ